jgi:hypothetical protein
MFMAVADSLPADNEQRRVAIRFKDLYRERYGIEPNIASLEGNLTLLLGLS